MLLTSDIHPHRTSHSGPVPFGSGLNTLSYFTFFDTKRIPWKACWPQSGDCLTPKGFTAARTIISPGVYLDFYNLHAEAGDETMDFFMRTLGYRQLSDFIKDYSAGNAIIIAGDTNTRYTSAKDPIREFLQSTGTSDVWVQLYKGDNPPPTGRSIECPFPVAGGRESNDCEQIDKVLYRSSPLLTLIPTAFKNENAKFLRPDGGPLSDHFPVAVDFEWRLPERLRLSDKIVGGTQGDWFSDAPSMSPDNLAVQISLRGGLRLDRVETLLRDGRRTVRGGMGGSPTGMLDVRDGVREMRVCEADTMGERRVVFLKVVNERGEEVRAGAEAGDCREWRKPDAGRWGIAGWVGRSRAEVNALGAVWGKF